MRRLSGLLTLAVTMMLTLVAGCVPAPVRPDPPPREVKVVVRQFVPLDKSLTQRVPLAMPANKGGDELLRVARERRAAIEQANRQLGAIESAQPQGDEK
jgi:hypothetical protein